MTPGRLPATLLVVAVLVCHGLFGAAHQAFAPAATPAAGMHGHHAPTHSQMAGYGEDDGGHQATHLAGSAECAAVLITVLMGTLGLLFSLRSWNARGIFWPAGRNPRAVGIRLHLPRGPTLPALQVFRL